MQADEWEGWAARRRTSGWRCGDNRRPVYYSKFIIGKARYLRRCSDLVAIGGQATYPGHRKSVARDPSRKRSIIAAFETTMLSLRANSIRTGVTPTRLRTNPLALLAAPIVFNNLEGEANRTAPVSR